MKLNLANRFITYLPADSLETNERRQVSEACYSFVLPKKTKTPELLHVSRELLNDLGITINATKTEEFLKIFTGNKVLENTKPYAMCYGGHQFGHWAGQLGDGRAINLFEIENNNINWKLQLKGAGETPYSRTADGLAVLRSSIREYLCSEAMFHLGIPTTRALSLSLTGDEVLRDVMYNGNPAYEKGAVVCRVSPSFLRFGSFEIFSSKKDVETLKTLVDYTITEHFSNCDGVEGNKYVQFFNAVAQQSLDMVIHWQRVGFVHGVMNTDNMSILGLTIDYGPYGWLEGFDNNWTPNTTDAQNKRYRFGAQIDVVLWNLYQLANALYPLIKEAEGLEKVLQNFAETSQNRYVNMMRDKLGFTIHNPNDAKIILELEDCLQLTETDMTIFFRSLPDITLDTYKDWFKIIEQAFYAPETITEVIKKRWDSWFKVYASRLNLEHITQEDRKTKMNLVNPKYVLRNYMSQLAIDAANKGDNSLINEIFKLLKLPYDEQPENEKWFAKRPEWARHKVGCSMLSCSS